MECWHIVTIAGVVGIIIMWLGLVTIDKRLERVEGKVGEVADHLLYQKTSQPTRQRGTPEQERGSDDTG